jgi:hypothetical protein
MNLLQAIRTLKAGIPLYRKPSDVRLQDTSKQEAA